MSQLPTQGDTTQPTTRPTATGSPAEATGRHRITRAIRAAAAHSHAASLFVVMAALPARRSVRRDRTRVSISGI